MAPATVDPDAREQELRTFLGGFDFHGDMASASIGHFSGGEKARLTLALIVRQKPNLLLLDEPTNHLDIEMREALTEALQDYDGALVVIAHDRHLLRATTDVLWIVADGASRRSTATSTTTATGCSTRAGASAAIDPAAATTAPAPAVAPGVDRKAQKREEAQQRQRLADARKPFLTRQAALEREMKAYATEKEALDAWLASEAAYTEAAKDELKEKIARQGEVVWQLARLETEWLESPKRWKRPGRRADRFGEIGSKRFGRPSWDRGPGRSIESELRQALA